MNYKVLKQQNYQIGNFKIVPIRFQDKYDIMKWRNEQIYHLRQQKPLTEADQNKYFESVVSKLFDQEYPNQILFSYLEGEQCIGYGGLVHINWVDNNAEISFIMATHLEKEFFKIHWVNYLNLIEKVAFQELNLHKIYTYAFDIRPHLYEAIESAGFKKEAVLKDHCNFNGVFKDVIIHSKFNLSDKNMLKYRTLQEVDKDLIFDWNNDIETRLNSFQSDAILKETHDAWFQKKVSDEKAFYLIVLHENKPLGLIRYDASDNSSTVGINLSKDSRGKGLSSMILKETAELYFSKYDKPVLAWIKPSNLASIKAFERAGYKFEKETTIMNQKAFVYKLEKVVTII